MSSKSDKKKETRRYRLAHVAKDPSMSGGVRRSGDSYGDFIGRGPRQRYFCKNCYRVGNNMKTCPTCTADTVMLDSRARVPKKSASKTKWRIFFANFFPDLLTRMD